jgi:hypothetical protein
LRIWAILSYSPAVLSSAVHDAAAYIDAAHYGLENVTLEPSGYPLFLRLVHELSHALTFTIIVQHGLGIATGVLLFMTIRRLGAPAWLGLVPAAIVWFNGDQLFLEHAPMSETLFEFIAAAMLYAGVRSLEGGWRWAALFGALAAASITVRSVGLLLPAIVIVWLAVALRRYGAPWRRPSLALLIGALLIAGLYGAAEVPATGHLSSILSEGSGWNLYARTAPFADCAHFHPPAGTARLCQSIPPAKRPGPSYYLWIGGPARAAFGGPPRDDGRLKAFGLAAVEHQPLQYLDAIGAGLVAYFDPPLGPHWPNDFAGVEPLNFRQRGPAVDPDVRKQVLGYYGPFSPPSTAAVNRLHDYQRVFRVTGPMLLSLLLLGLCSLLPGPPLARRGPLLLVAVALYLLVMPVAVLHTEWRYAIPALGPLAAAAALGAWSLGARIRVLGDATKARTGNRPRGAAEPSV